MAPSRQNKKALRVAKERMYAIIDHATAENLSAPNFALNTDMVTSISGGTDPQYMANKACKQLKKRIQCRKGNAQMLTLQASAVGGDAGLLEHCVRTCGDPFHKELAASDLLPELVKLSDRSAWCSPEVQQQVLALLQEWAYTLRPSQFVNAYNKLKARGMTFPPRSGEVAATGAFQPYPGISPGPPSYGPLPGSQPGSGMHPAADPFGAGDGAPGSPVGTPARGSALLSPDQDAAKIGADLEVAANTVSLLGEVLGGVAGGDDPAGVKEDYISDMAAQATAMQARLADLIPRLGDEALLSRALELNDEAQRALARYKGLVDVAEGSNPFADGAVDDIGSSSGAGPGTPLPPAPGPLAFVDSVDAFSEPWGVAPAAPAPLYPAIYDARLPASQNGGGAGVSDAFRDLVKLQKKVEEAPPPPKGSPMRRDAAAEVATTSAANGGGSSGFGAFDAFDAIVPPKI